MEIGKTIDDSSRGVLLIKNFGKFCLRIHKKFTNSKKSCIFIENLQWSMTSFTLVWILKTTLYKMLP